MPDPVTREAARVRALAAYDRHASTWATAPHGAATPVLDLPLHPPTERAVLDDVSSAVGWVDTWRDVAGVRWGRRRWPSIGTQEVPERLVLDAPADVARLGGRGAHWRTLSSRFAELLDRFGSDAPVRRHAATIAEMTEPDFDRLVAVAAWLVEHPRSGRYPRALPVAGVDSKWFEKRRALVTALVETANGPADLGLAAPPVLVRFRALDPQLAIGGLVDLAAPVQEVAKVAGRPRVTVVVENLQTFLALPPIDGAVAVHGAGYAVERVAAVPAWAQGPVVYWGDLDVDGFAILNRLRTRCRHVESVLMDRATLLEHRDLWGADPGATTSRSLTELREGEQDALAALRTYGGIRLEQERLGWPWCEARLDQL